MRGYSSQKIAHRTNYALWAVHYNFRYLSIFKLIFLRFRGNMTSYERRDHMDKNSALYQLMYIRVNEGLDGITQADEEYQEISKRSPGNTWISWTGWGCRRMSGH